MTLVEASHRFEWATKFMSVPMKATHRIEATPQGCRNTLGIELSGFGGRLLGLLSGRQLAATLRTENEGFKRAAEAAATVAA